MLKRKLKSEPGEPFINFLCLAHECKVAGYPEDFHHLHLPGDGVYVADESNMDDSSESDLDEDIDDMRLFWKSGLVEMKIF